MDKITQDMYVKAGGGFTACYKMPYGQRRYGQAFIIGPAMECLYSEEGKVHILKFHQHTLAIPHLHMLRTHTLNILIPLRRPIDSPILPRKRRPRHTIRSFRRQS